MNALNDKTNRHELIRRYLDAETTIEEERLLVEYFMHTEDELSPEEEDVKLIVLSTARHIKDGGLDDEKEAEFDRMMKTETATSKSHHMISRTSWSLPVAAALILVLCLMTRRMVKDAPATQYAKSVTTTATHSLPAPLGEQPQHKESVTDFQMAKDGNGDTTQKSVNLIPDNNTQETNMSISADNKQVAAVTEPSERETTRMPPTFANAAADDPEGKRYPMNVSAANYGGEYQGRNHFVSSRSITITTKNRPDGNASHYTVVNAGNGSWMIDAEIQDDSVIYIVDGVRVTMETAYRISPDCIKEKQRLKRGTADAIKVCADGLTRDVIVIRTKRADDDGQDHSLVPVRNGLLISDSDKSNGICLL